MNSFFPTLPSIDKKYSASLSCTKKKKKKKTIKERRTSVGKLSLPQIFFPSLLLFSFNLANNDQCSIDIARSFFIASKIVDRSRIERHRDLHIFTKRVSFSLILDARRIVGRNKWARVFERVFTRSKCAERNYTAL